MQHGRTPTTATTYLRPLLRLLDARGHDAVALFARHGVAPELMGQADARVPVAVTRELMAEAQRLTGEPALGLALARHAEYTTFGGLGLTLAAGGSVRTVLERIARYHALISDTVAMHIRDDGGALAVLIDERSDPPPHPQSILFLIATVVGLGRLRIGGDATPQRIVLKGVDAACLDASRRFFRCAVEAGDGYRIELAAQAAALVLEGSDPEMAAMLEQTLQARLAPSPGEDGGKLAPRLALWIEQRLPDGEPSLGDAAKTFALSERSLQRRLGEEGLGWSKLLDDTRRALAERHLHTPGMSLTQLAFLLGFADVSSFSRAFRKWFGVPASRLRRQ
ncbi:MAG: AraC family transcriptional regulator ligand-binding domain-containing protein [Pseudomonadota bacterium]